MTTLREDLAAGLEGELPRLRVEPMPVGEARFERLARCVRTHSAVTLAYDNQDGCLICDVQTANLAVEVAKALKPENRAKFLAMDFGAMVTIAWKLVS